MADELRSASPSLRDKISEIFSKALGGGDETRGTARFGHTMAEGLDMIPGVGTATYGHDAARDVRRGDYVSAAKNGLVSLLSALPGAGFSKEASLMGRSPYARIPGLPKEINLPTGETLAAKPIPGVMDAAADYARSRGMPHTVPKAFPPQDPENARAIASWYDKAPDEVGSPATFEAYKRMADETKGQYQALKNRGYNYSFFKQGPDGNFVDPYAASPALGYKDLAENKHLQIFPTRGGFGSINEADPRQPMLQDSGEKFGDEPATYNDLFRAVHDSFGHFGSGNAFFRAPGEERAWNLHSLMYSPEARGPMTAETRGQNSWVNHGPYADANRGASGADTTYADQKSLVPPDWVQHDPRLTPYELGLRVPAPRMSPSVGAFADEASQ
jgi:hypothetical protein